jgi:hypothetical protein
MSNAELMPNNEPVTEAFGFGHSLRHSTDVITRRRELIYQHYTLVIPSRVEESLAVLITTDLQRSRKSEMSRLRST